MTLKESFGVKHKPSFINPGAFGKVVALNSRWDAGLVDLFPEATNVVDVATPSEDRRRRVVGDVRGWSRQIGDTNTSSLDGTLQNAESRREFTLLGGDCLI